MMNITNSAVAVYARRRQQQGFRIIKPARLFRGNPLVCRTDVAYDKAASSLLL